MPRIEASTQRTPCAAPASLGTLDRDADRRRAVAQAGAEPEPDLGRLTLVAGRSAWASACSSAPPPRPKRQTSRSDLAAQAPGRASPRSSPPDSKSGTTRSAARRSASLRPSGSRWRRTNSTRDLGAAARPLVPVLAGRSSSAMLEQGLRLRELSELQRASPDADLRSAWSRIPSRRCAGTLEEVERRRQVAARARALPGRLSRTRRGRAAAAVSSVTGPSSVRNLKACSRW